jgi:ribose transport system substrate-binding protein
MALVACSSSSSSSASVTASTGTTAAASATAASAAAASSAPASSAAASSAVASAAGSGADASSGVAHAQSQLAKYRAAVTSYPAPGPAIPASKIAALKGKTILFVPFSLSISYFTEEAAAMTSALSRIGVTLKTCDPKFLPSAAASCLSQAKADGAVAVVTGSISYNLIPNAYDALASQHIPVLLGGSPPAAGKTNTSSLAFQDSDSTLGVVGALAADSIIANSKGNANVLFVRITDTASITHEGDAMTAEFKAYCPGCKITVDTFNTANIAQLPSSASAALLRTPDINYVLPQTDADVSGAMAGAQSAGFINKVTAVSTDGTLGALTLIKQGKFVSTDIGYSGVYQGWDQVDAALRMIAGMDVPSNYFDPIRVFDTSNVGPLTLTASESDTNDWYGSDSYQSMFVKLWGNS